MTNVFAAALAGLLSGIHVASWGMYKDAPHEGFELRKYTIPMQFAVLGRTVESRVLRAALGLGYLCGMLVMMALIAAYQGWAGPELSLVEVALFASAGGWMSAVGGAWRDAPIEGFQTLKFFRSPALAALWALLLAQLSSDLVLVTLAATGYTIATTETWLTVLVLLGFGLERSHG